MTYCAVSHRHKTGQSIDLEYNEDYLPESFQASFQTANNKRIAKKAQMLVLSNFILEEVSLAQLDIPAQLKLLTIDGLMNNHLLFSENRNELIARVLTMYTSLDGLATLMESSNFDMCL